MYVHNNVRIHLENTYIYMYMATNFINIKGTTLHLSGANYSNLPLPALIVHT